MTETTTLSSDCFELPGLASDIHACSLQSLSAAAGQSVTKPNSPHAFSVNLAASCAVGSSVTQYIQALLQRLQEPTAAALSAEYPHISQLPKFLSTLLPAPGCKLAAPLLPQKQLSTLMQRWCSLAEPLLLVVTDQKAFAQDPTGSAVYGAGTLLNALGAFLQYWVDVQADEAAAAAVKQQIAQYTSGGLVIQHCGSDERVLTWIVFGWCPSRQSCRSSGERQDTQHTTGGWCTG